MRKEFPYSSSALGLKNFPTLTLHDSIRLIMFRFIFFTENLYFDLVPDLTLFDAGRGDLGSRLKTI